MEAICTAVTGYLIATIGKASSIDPEIRPVGAAFNSPNYALARQSVTTVVDNRRSRTSFPNSSFRPAAC
jgi:hypothetical protein